MRIKTLHLENIRSHVKTEVPFAEGFNCLVGGLGRGKSTILYAIDFALFGDPLGRSYDYLLREGAGASRVVLEFVEGGKTYILQRGLRRRGEKSISQDLEQLKFLKDGKEIASAKAEAVAEQLKAITGLDRDVFREVVWVRQEHLKELLDVTPRERQKKLDQLFKLSDYEEAWSNLAGYQKEYKGERRAYESDPDITGVSGLQKEYNRKVEEFAAVHVEFAELKEKTAEAEAKLKEADNRLRGLEELRKQTEALRRKEAELQANIVNLENLCAKLTNEIQQKQLLIADLKQRLNAAETKEKLHRNKLQESKLKPDQTVEELKEHLTVLQDQMANIMGEQEAVKRETAVSQKRTSSLTAENKCPLCLQNLSGEYKENLLGQLRRENTERENRLVELQKKLEELKNLSGTVDRAFSDLRQIKPQIEELKSRIAEENKNLDKISDESEAKQKQEKQFRESLRTIAEEISKFDIATLESARKTRDESFEHLSNLKHSLEAAEKRETDIASRLDEFKDRLDHAQQKIERMEKIGGLLEVIDGIRGAYRSIQPKLRGEFVVYLEKTVQQVLNGLVGDEGYPLIVKIDDTYTPIIRSEEGYDRDVSNLSGGERTLLAFAYRIGLGQLIMQSKTGHGLHLLLLDEPTESLGSEDGSVERLADAISRLRAVEQIIAVTHSEAFAEKAEHVIRVDKEVGASSVSIER